MQIGQIIRKYRKAQNMTQEQMAHRLGVTTPAVNKWEKGNSYPDITMLAPIARLLHISLDTLLSFREELTGEEIEAIIYEADERFKRDSYDKVFQWAKEKIEMYPNCKTLIWQLATILDAQQMMQDITNTERYDSYILECYEQVIESEEEELRTQAADSLFAYYLRKEQYEKAEEYLSYYSEQNPERKRKQAWIFSKTGRRDEAYKAYEELLFSEYQMLNMVFNSIYMLAMEDGKMSKAHKIVDKQQELARLFEMGAYHEASCRLELATAEKDVDTVIETVQKMLESVEETAAFMKSDLYEHMTFRKMRPEFIEEMKENLLNCFRDEETFGFMKADERWKEIVKVKE